MGIILTRGSSRGETRGRRRRWGLRVWYNAFLGVCLFRFLGIACFFFWVFGAVGSVEGEERGKGKIGSGRSGQMGTGRVRFLSLVGWVLGKELG
uniref:Transmembrane protein n=1 Tax=Solanum lycopersicum TaxID=4081 RepID=A0A3Q7HKN4_SOLLC